MDDHDSFLQTPAGAHLASHREFFADQGDTRQVWARDTRSNALVYLPPGGADEFRARCDAGELICPIPGCEAPAFRARGADIRRHHFAHRQAHASHKPYEVWLQETLATLEQWLAGKWASLIVKRSAMSLELTSPRTGKVVVIEPCPPRLSSDDWLDRDRAATDARRSQLLLRPTAGVLRVKDELAEGLYATRLYGLVATIVTFGGAAIAINPQGQLVGTITSRRLALDAGLTTDRHPADGRLIIEPLDACAVDQRGVQTPAAKRITDCPTTTPAAGHGQPPWSRRSSPPPRVDARPPPAKPRPVERLVEIPPGTIVTEDTSDDLRWAIFRQAMQRKRQPPS